MTNLVLNSVLPLARVLLLLFSLGNAGSAHAQKPPAKAVPPLLLAANEGAAGNVDATEIFLRYEGFKQLVENTLGVPVSLVAVRDAKALRSSLETRAYTLVLSRPVDILAEAIRDFGYQPVVVAKEMGNALFIVPKDSPIKTIAQIRGKSIVTPDRYSYMWRIAAAMMRDNNISISEQKVRSMRDQAAIGWSMENGFFDVGVVASFSGVGRTWEKRGGRVIAKSRNLPTVPLVASPRLSAAQVAKLRAALIALGSSESGAAILKQIGVEGFMETSPDPFLNLLSWLGDLELQKD
jgi:ABC-type phosphate/phosphonate transport system substrate-binding protein